MYIQSLVLLYFISLLHVWGINYMYWVHSCLLYANVSQHNETQWTQQWASATFCFMLVALQGVQQEPTGMAALRNVPAQMGVFVNWTDLAYALKDLLDPTAQRKVHMWYSCSLTACYYSNNMILTSSTLIYPQLPSTICNIPLTTSPIHVHLRHLHTLSGNC